jgi:hypothetical protein
LISAEAVAEASFGLDVAGVIRDAMYVEGAYELADET